MDMDTDEMEVEHNDVQQTWDPQNQDITSNTSMDIGSFNKILQDVQNGACSSDVTNLDFGSLNKLLQEVHNGNSSGMNSGTGSWKNPDQMKSLILADLCKSNNWDSMESIPSATVQKFGGTDVNSLPQMNDSDVETHFQQQHNQPLPVVLNNTILVSPTPDVPIYQALQDYHPTTSTIDPNVEIHGNQQASNYVGGQQFHTENGARNPNEPVTSTNDEIMNSMDSDDSNFKLPPEFKLELMLSYSSLPVSGTISIDKPEGCILYYQKTTKDVGDTCQRIQFPSLDNSHIQKKFAKVNPKAAELTERALTALQGGLQLLFRANDGVYAIRRSRGKIYWTSTQQQNIEEPNELQRNCEVLVFNWKKFTMELSQLYVQKATSQLSKLPDLPAIYFTFAQKWCKGACPVTSCLVWAKVVPKKAEEMVNGLFPKARPARVTSLNSDYLQFSNSS